MKKHVFFLVYLLSMVALAAGGEGHGEHGAHDDHAIPLNQIGWQAANLGILLIGLFFLLKTSIKEAFANRRQDFINQAEKTKSALKSAEQALSGIKQKLSTLESGEASALTAAKAEAETLKASLIKDAEALSEKMKKDSTLALANELNKAKTEINNAILTSAMGAASKNLSDKAAGGAQEASFLKQLEQVRP